MRTTGTIEQAGTEAFRIGRIEQQIFRRGEVDSRLEDHALGLRLVGCTDRVEHLLRLSSSKSCCLYVLKAIVSSEGLTQIGIARPDEGILPIAIIEIRQVGAKGVRILRGARIAEGTVGCAFEIDLDVVIPSAAGDRQQIGNKVNGCFPENAELLIGPLHVVTEDDTIRKRSRIAGIGSREREVRRKPAERLGQFATRIGIVVAFLEHEVGIEPPCSHTEAIFLRRAEPQFLREHLKIAIRGDIEVGRLACPARCRVAGIADRPIADVIWKVLAGEKIIRVVDPLLGFAFRVGTVVNHIEHAQTAFDAPGSVGEIVLQPVVFKALDLKIIEIEFRIGEEYSVALQTLAAVRYGDSPVRRYLVKGRDAEA